METERRETGTLIGSDKVEAHCRLWHRRPEDRLDRARDDRQGRWPSHHTVFSTSAVSWASGDDHYPLPWQSIEVRARALAVPNQSHQQTGSRVRQKYGNDNAWDWDDPGRARGQ